MEDNLIVIHFGELWLKGRNRGNFVKRLHRNVRLCLKDEGYKKIENARDRFILHLDRSSDRDAITRKLSFVFGISWFAPVVVTSNKVSDIIKTASRLYKKGEKVRIEAHRSFKDLNYTSHDLVGAFLKNKKRFRFELDKEGEKELLINITKEGAMLIKQKCRGAGGLPVGSSGKAVVLLSGGIDSPVAAFYAMKRGLEPVYLHVHAFNNNKQAASSKIPELLKTLSRYSRDARAYYAPAYLFQSATVKIPRKYELVVFRRFLFRLAEKLAEKEKANAIVTGESLGQVASQTVANMASAQLGIKPIIVRPLIGFDKEEIISQAKRLGTYETSIKRYKDVCSIGIKNPSTRMDEKLVSKLYKECKLDTVLKRTEKLMK